MTHRGEAIRKKTAISTNPKNKATKKSIVLSREA